MCDCEPSEAYGYAERKARKQHRCCECHGTICAGERYHYHSGVQDGRPWSYKVCVDCEELRDLAYHATDCCVAFTALAEVLGEFNVLELAEKFDAIAEKRGGVPMSTVQ